MLAPQESDLHVSVYADGEVGQVGSRVEVFEEISCYLDLGPWKCRLAWGYVSWTTVHDGHASGYEPAGAELAVGSGEALAQLAVLGPQLRDVLVSQLKAAA